MPHGELDVLAGRILAAGHDRILYSEDVAQGILMIADARKMDDEQIAYARLWVEGDDNGLLVTGSGPDWVRANGGDLGSYPMNRIMSHFGMRFSDAWSRSDR